MTRNPSPALLNPVIAHRGASGTAPENTLAAMALAAKLGAKAVELDVMISRDGVAYVHHDDGLERCTNGTGYLCAHTSNELDKLTASKGMPGFENEPLPRFDAVLDLLAQHDMALNVEIKPTPGLEIPTAKATCESLKQLWPTDLPLVISSFSREALKPCMEWLPAVPRALIVCAIPENWQTELIQLQASNLHCAGPLVQTEDIKAITEAGFGIYCFTVNAVDEYNQLLSNGVHGVFSDYPEKLLIQSG
ncbi:MAG: glycerophosphodiester phosphodiesterase [Gammaproteobacteria bacterium]|nr:glycerophosphodiester phosphodiesterase [Gammaproteobacteria bacterium]